MHADLIIENSLLLRILNHMFTQRHKAPKESKNNYTVLVFNPEKQVFLRVLVALCEKRPQNLNLGHVSVQYLSV